jgi:hypothetical protein
VAATFTPAILPEKSSADGHRIPELDGVRGLAIALALVYYYAVIEVPGSRLLYYVSLPPHHVVGCGSVFRPYRLSNWWHTAGSSRIPKLLPDFLRKAHTSHLPSLLLDDRTALFWSLDVSVFAIIRGNNGRSGRIRSSLRT